MEPLLSAADAQLLNHYQVQIEIDAATGYGLIILQNRRLKVSILNNQPAEQGNPHWQAMPLGEHQMRDTAGKVAVMLLKKQLLQGEQAQPLNFTIDQPGIKRLADQKQFTHEDPVPEKNTRNDFNALVAYLNKKEVKEEPDDSEVKGEDLQINVQENPALAPPPLNPKPHAEQKPFEDEIITPKQQPQPAPNGIVINPRNNAPQLVVGEDLLAALKNNGGDRFLRQLEEKRRQEEQKEISKREEKGKEKETKKKDLPHGSAALALPSSEGETELERESKSSPLPTRFSSHPFSSLQRLKPMPIFPNFPKEFLPKSAPLANGPLKIEIEEIEEENPYVFPGMEAESINWEFKRAKRLAAAHK